MLKQLLYYFEGLDESILNLNKCIVEDDFEFEKYTLEQFEKKFKRRFKNIIQENHPLGFVGAVSRLGCFNKEIFQNGYILFLNDNTKNPLEDAIDIRLENLIQNLKFFKHGHIKLVSAFEFPSEESDFIGPVIFSSPSKEIKNRYTLSNEDILKIKFFKQQYKPHQYIELAFHTFLESYNIEDEKLKFVVLMVCLESIFNKSKDEPIRHIISRHAALTITRDKQMFAEKVKRLKFLYDLRSSLVHGKEENKEDNKEHKKYKQILDNIHEYVLELEELVRSVLRQLIVDKQLFGSATPETKEELFNRLNESSINGIILN